MRIIAVMSPKGGIGKTTTSDSIAYMLGEEQGKRVLAFVGMFKFLKAHRGDPIPPNNSRICIVSFSMPYPSISLSNSCTTHL